jgi:hypothetical protein
MNAPVITLLGMAAVAVLLVIVPVAADSFARYRRRGMMRCPETGTEANVQVDALHAALTTFPGPARLRVEDCSRWPARQHCAQECLRAC